MQVNKLSIDIRHKLLDKLKYPNKTKFVSFIIIKIAKICIHKYKKNDILYIIFSLIILIGLTH